MDFESARTLALTDATNHDPLELVNLDIEPGADCVVVEFRFGGRPV